MSFQDTLLRGTSLLALLSRFSLVGALATIVYFIVANVGLLVSDADAAQISVFAYLVGMVVSYLGQSRVTFQVSGANLSQVARFCVLSSAGLAISYYAVHFAQFGLGIAPLWGTIAVSLLVPVMSFIVMKLWVFKSPESVPGADG